MKRVRPLNEIASKRGQSLGKMAIAWVLRDLRVTTALIGAQDVDQLNNSLAAITDLEFIDSELREIVRFTQDGSIDILMNAREKMV